MNSQGKQTNQSVSNLEWELFVFFKMVCLCVNFVSVFNSFDDISFTTGQNVFFQNFLLDLPILQLSGYSLSDMIFLSILFLILFLSMIALSLFHVLKFHAWQST